jgi:hypothetical protein
MMVATQQPAQASLYGVNGQVHWPTLLARAGIRSLILWPVVNFIGGVGGIRGVITSMAGGALYTGVELAWDTTNLAASVAAQQAQQPAANGQFFGVGDGLSDGPSAQQVIDTFSPPER